ncbi:hypothetical protein BD560DRAFT_400018 [Blakeslea trispora]|nr:hypothetical protein BD560DRAFT_400018 [Blakeslea trispora]
MNTSKKFKLFPQKKHKITPKESLSLEDLTTLVRRLSVQIDELESQKKPAKWIMDPYADSVVQDYARLVRQLEEFNPNCQFVVESAAGLPWPPPVPIEQQETSSLIETQYTHWCTLLRCLPYLDTTTSHYIKTVALYAMRDILSNNAAPPPPPPPPAPPLLLLSTQPSTILSSPPSPRYHRYRQQKWMHYKHKKRMADIQVSQSLRKIGSWFF